MNLEVRHIGLLLVLMTLTTIGHAQLQVRPIGQGSIVPSSNSRALAARDTVSLPFWDDFSFSSIEPDTTLWELNSGVFVNGTLGKVAPTINVASFDGNDLNGNPHNSESTTSQETDVLTSQPIDLSAVDEDKRNSVYLSFYWQMEGLGEIPEQKDSLKVDFKDKDGVWTTVIELAGVEENFHETFTKQSRQIDQEDYFHSGFQFRFRSIGNAQGPFDSWHIDYVYLNQDRTIESEDFVDRAIASSPTSIFSQYTMIPYDVIFDFPDTIYKDIEVEISTLENKPHPVSFRYDLIDTLQDQTVYNIPTTTGNPLGSLGRNTLTAEAVPSSQLADVDSDSLYLLSQFIFETGDLYFIKEIDGSEINYLEDENYNYRLNDTVRRYHEIHETLAYDDGQAEYAAGLNKIDAQIAVAFNIPSQDTLTHIDIYFPQINPSSSGERITLSVLDDLSGEASDVLRAQDFIIPGGSQLNQFNTFTLDVPIIVSGQFYVAMQQFTSDYIGIGLDNNNLIGTQKIWVNTEGEWANNLKVEGIVMIRSGFADSDYVVSDVEKPLEAKNHIYPNPADQVLNIEGRFDYFELFNLSGKIMVSGRSSQLFVSALLEGVYILKVRRDDRVDTHKVFISH